MLVKQRLEEIRNKYMSLEKEEEELDPPKKFWIICLHFGMSFGFSISIWKSGFSPVDKSSMEFKFQDEEIKCADMGAYDCNDVIAAKIFLDEWLNSEVKT